MFAPINNSKTNFARSLAVSPELCCASESDCICDYLSKAGQFSREKEKQRRRIFTDE